MRTIRVKVMVNVPKVPNYLLYDGGKVSIADVEDTELQYVAQAWTEALLERAAELRATRDTGEKS